MSAKQFSPLTMNPVAILIVDDHTVVRRGLRALLETQPGWTICGEASNGNEGVEKAAQQQPDVVILDIGMPEMNGVVATVRIREVAPHARVLVLTMHNGAELIQSCLEAGAQGYVLKSDAERDLISAVQAVVQHKTYFTESATNVVLESLRDKQGEATQETSGERLTSREQEVVQLLAEGRSNKEVAATLGIGTRTVESHRAKIMSKLHLGTFSDLMRYAIRKRIVEL
ncbi:MAG TPA: response regulator transcription factor [Terriglobales bacterium]